MEHEYPPAFKPAPEEDENWMDKYAPKDADEAAYFKGEKPAPKPQEHHPEPTAQQPKAKKHKKRRGLIVAAIIIVLAAGAGAFVVLKPHQAAAPTTKSSGTNSGLVTPTPPTDDTTSSKTYSSTNFALSIDVPTDWKTDDSATALTLTSPGMNLMKGTGGNVYAHVRITIQNKQTSIPAFGGKAATAVAGSEKIVYTKPTQNQRAQTYLTFAQYAASTSGLDAIYVTGDLGYDKLQTIPESDVIGSDPLISMTFLDCGTADCTATAKTVNVDSSSFIGGSLYKTAQATLKSLAVN